MCASRLLIHLNLNVSGESIHERHPLKHTRVINHDIRDWEREFVIWTCGIQVAEVDADACLSILFGNEDYVSNPIRVLLFSDEPRVVQFLNF